ncbi:bifunctional apoptosis regulator [Micractinium conductrix]|uniref:Bifunctional apoptosis regulator n=1 Tax=Micractinium conductrix TaxID=554055 RepID=A0A2P6V885_9CHLO|nr:bifunctional apoptosis regulator [Micractinium conductrix]|eukprot:PSC70297.1 bifunctional apoptosis regulator [Micractinium conductrix]
MPGSSPVARRTRSAAAKAAVHEPTAAPPPVLPAPCPAPAAAEVHAYSNGKRPREDEPSLNEDDFSCSICFGLLVDPVVSSCGHDACELCLSRWVVDQGKRSCPSCRQPVAAKLPGICRRLQRTIAALFPRRLEERRAERGQERAALAAEKQAGAEARRHERAARQASADERGQLMQALLEQLYAEPIFRQQPRGVPAGGQPAAPPPPPTQQQQAGRLVQRRYPQQPAIEQHRFEVQVFRFTSVPTSTGIGMQPASMALPLDPEPASAAAGGRGALAGGPPQPAHGSPGWPGGPPLAEMHFDMGWHDPAAGQGRRRRRLCTR